MEKVSVCTHVCRVTLIPETSHVREIRPTREFKAPRFCIHLSLSDGREYAVHVPCRICLDNTPLNRTVQRNRVAHVHAQIVESKQVSSSDEFSDIVSSRVHRLI